MASDGETRLYLVRSHRARHVGLDGTGAGTALRARLGMTRRLTAMGALLLCHGCATAPPVLGTALPVFSPNSFFEGRTEGEGVLKTLFSASKKVVVHGSGRVMPGGILILDQTVEEQGKPATRREWHIEETAAGHFSGALSDAEGPVEAEATGNRLRIRFMMKGGLRAEQWLYLAADGRSVRNHMTFRKLGVVVATLNETIRKTG